MDNNSQNHDVPVGAGDGVCEIGAVSQSWI